MKFKVFSIVLILVLTIGIVTSCDDETENSEPTPVETPQPEEPEEPETPEPSKEYRYVFGYVFSDDLLLFLTPTITISIDGEEPQTFSIAEGEVFPASDKIDFFGFQISVSPQWSKVWMKGKTFDSEKKGTISVSYVKKDVDYSLYENADLSIISEPFTTHSKTYPYANITINSATFTFLSITLGGRTLEEKINDILESSRNTISF